MADQNNPWDTTPAADSAVQSADAWGTPATAPTDGGGADWLTSTPAPNVEHFNILDPFHKTLIPLDSWVTEGIDWVVTHFRPVFQGVRVPVDYILNGFQQLLLGMPAPVAIIVFALIAWQISGVGMGVATLVSLIAIGAIGAWSQAMVTLALVLTALLFCIVIGLPLGIWLARSPRAAKIIRPLLDAMQTTPAFVYLVPIVMLFGIGNVPGVVVTIIFALPPIIRLTILGINQVPAQNATGNWIKVVQRLPVRIELDQKQLEQYPLRIGLSTLVSVNTTNRDGQVLANKVRSTPVAVSTAREISLAPVNKLIDDIVKANAG